MTPSLTLPLEEEGGVGVLCRILDTRYWGKIQVGFLAFEVLVFRFVKEKWDGRGDE